MDNPCNECLVQTCCSKVCVKKLKQYRILKNIEILAKFNYDEYLLYSSSGEKKRLKAEYEKAYKRRRECKSEIVRISMIQLERKR